MADTSPALFEQVLLDMSSNKNKASATELQHQMYMYKRKSKKERHITRLEENPNGMLVTMNTRCGRKGSTKCAAKR